MIYQPSEDSYLLEEVVKDFLKNKTENNEDIKILDMGSGSGIQALACKKLGFKNILAVDINPEAVSHLKSLDFNSIQSDLFSNIDKKDDDKFDLIIFNAPYLPEDKREPADSKLATTAGKKGYEIIIRFLEQAKVYLNDEENGRILLLFSSLSKPEVILKRADELGYEYKLMKNMRLDFEELYVYEFKHKS